MSAAQRGTLFLDRIGEMSLAARRQSYCAVLQRTERQRRRRRQRPGLEARIIATTSRDLRVLAASGRFRQELY